MLESVAANLLATGLVSAGSRGREYYENRLHEDFSDDINELGVEFNRALRDNLTETIKEQGINQLSKIENKWSVVVRTLNADTDLDFTDENAAIEAITDAILHAAGGEASVRPWIRRNVKQAVAKAYSIAVEDFKQRIAGTDRADLLGFANDQELLDRCDEIKTELDEVLQLLQRRQYYDPFEATPEGFERARQRLTSEDIEFVDRDDLPDNIQSDRLLLYGRKGVGKSRALAELTRRTDATEIEHIIVPREGFDSREDVRAIEQESFSGDVLLLWDDIHKVTEEGDDVAVPSLIKKLEDILDESGYSLQAFVTSRAERLDRLPGGLDDPDSFWGDFEQIELPPLDPQVLVEIFSRALEYYEVEASEEVARQFVSQALETDPSPFYVVSVVGLAEDELTTEDIEKLPETALEVWEYQYGQLGEDSQRVLLAIKLLSLADAPFYKSLVEGVYREVFDRPAPQYRFRNPVEPLLNRQWITLTESDADPFDEETEYRVHDIQLEAIQDSVDNALEPFSNYLSTQLQSDLPEAGDGQRAPIHRQFANTVRRMDVQGATEIATCRYQYILNSIDSEDGLTLLYYGSHLDEQGSSDEATGLFSRAIESFTEEIKRGRDGSEVYALRGMARRSVSEYQRAVRDFDEAIDRGGDAHLYSLRGRARSEAGDHKEAAADFSEAISRGLDDPDVYYSRGTARGELHDHEGAAEDFSEAINRGLDNSDVYYNRGIARGRLGDHEGAVEDFSVAIDRGQDDADIYYSRGKTRLLTGDYEGAVEDFSAAIDRGRDDADVYYNRGTARGKLGDHEGTVEDFSAAIDRDRNDADVYYGRGNARLLTGNYEGALNDFSAAINRGQDNADVYYSRGKARLLTSNYEGAVEDFSAAIDRGRNDAEVYYNRGTARGELGDHEGALEDFSAAIDRGRDDAEVYHNRANASLFTGNYEGAIEDFSAAIDRGQDNADVYHHRAIARSELDDHEGADEDFSEAIGRDLDNATVYYSRGTERGELGDYEGAVEDFSEAIDRGRDDADVYYGRGTARGELGDHERAAEDFSEAINRGLDDAEVYYNRGKARLFTGNYEGAVEDFSAAIDRGQDDAEVYYNRGTARGELGDHEGALEDFSAAIDRGRDDAEVYHNRANASLFTGNYEGAVEDFSAAIDRGQDNADVYHYRAIARGELHDHEGADEDFSEAINRGLDDSDVYYSRGKARLLTSNYEGAVEDFSAAINRGRDNADVYYLRGRAKAEVGNYEGAVEDFEQKIRSNPEDSSVLWESAEAKIVSGNAESALEDARKARVLADSDDERAVSLLLHVIAKILCGSPITEESREYRAICEREFEGGWDLEILDAWLQRADLSDENRGQIATLLGLYRSHQPGSQ